MKESQVAKGDGNIVSVESMWTSGYINGKARL